MMDLPSSPSPIELVSISDYSLLLRFDNGELRRFDVEPYLADPFFAPLRNRALLGAATCNSLTLEWPGGIDICPDELYANSVPERPEGCDQASSSNSIGEIRT